MSGYMLVNLADVDDMAERNGQGERGAARFARGALGAEQVGVALHQLRPGKRQGFGHRHQDAEEVYVVLAGSGRVKLDDRIVELRERDALRVAPATARRFEAGDDGLDLLVFGQHFEKDGELLPEFWAD